MDHKPLAILIVDDEEIIHQSVGAYLSKRGHRVDWALDGQAGLERLAAQPCNLVLVDVRMPGMDGLAFLAAARQRHPELCCVVITGHADVDTAVEALRLGADDFLRKPIHLHELDATIEKIRRLQQLRRDGRRLRQVITTVQHWEDVRAQRTEFIGRSAATQQVRDKIERLAAAGCETVLVSGETGTGKEIVARELHRGGPNEGAPFIAVTCPAIPDSLIESELFGHVKGSFTGATQDRAGCFELADGGTLFLDEVGDLSARAQAALLRVLETRTFRRVGGADEIRVSLRVIAATNAPLQERVAAQTFRGDLFYRLNVYLIELLPLRQRREDILPLAEHFLAACARNRGLPGTTLSAAAVQQLLAYDFPGNARELLHMMERATLLSDAATILPEHLGLRPGDASVSIPATATPADLERLRLRHALEAAHWNRRQAARDLGMGYSTLRRKIAELGLK